MALFHYITQLQFEFGIRRPLIVTNDHVPFGGRKGSSYGAAEFYTTVKTAYTDA